MIETSTAFTEMEKLHLDHIKKSSPFQGCSASTSKQKPELSHHMG
jgi:hypothetical protein